MAKSDGSVILDTRINTAGFGKGVNTMQKQIGGLSGAIGKLGGVIAATFAVGKLIQFGKEAIDLGSDLQEVQNVVDVTFTTMNEQVNEFAKNAAETAGLSETMAKRYTGTFGAMAKAFGFTESESYNMATALTQLTGDVASFYNLTQDEAYTKLKSVFTGETESLKDLGVVMTQTALDSFAMAKGYGKTTKAMTEAEKVSLRFAFVTEQLNSASGDFIRTQDSWANQTRILSLNFDTFKANIGQALINIFTPFLKVINQTVDKMAELSQHFVAFSEMLVGKSTSGGGGSPGDALAEIENGYENIADATEEASKAQENYLTGLDEIKTFSSNNNSKQNEILQGNLITNPEDIISTEENAKKTTNSFAERLANAFKTEDWSAIGNYLSDGIVFGLNSLSDKISGVDWEDIGESVGNFLEGLDWTDILSSVGSLIWDAINAGVDFYKGMFDAAPVETSIITAIALLKFTGLGSVIWNAMKQPIADYFKNNKSTVGTFFKDKISSAIPSALRIGGIITIIFAGVNFAVDLGKNLSKSLLERSNELFGTEFKTEFIDNLGLSDFLFDLGPKVFEEFLNNPMFTLDMWSQILFGYSSFSEMLDAIISESDFVNKANDFIKTAKESITSGVASVTTLLTAVIKRHIEPLFSKEAWLKNMSGIKEAFSQVWKGAVNIAISLLNTFIDYINEKMYFKWDAFKDPIFGTELIPSGNVQLFTVPKIPYLATGAVIPPNAPFMAVLGDQKHGTNIEAPLDTIKQAVREVIGNNGGGKYHFTAQINRRTLFEEMIDEARLRQTTSGRNPFDLA